MAGVAAKLFKERAVAEGLGSNRKPVKYLNQDYEALRDQCLQAGTLFKDEEFPACPSALGYRELGPYSPKTQGVVWKRPTVRVFVITCFASNAILTGCNLNYNLQIQAEFKLELFYGLGKA